MRRIALAVAVSALAVPATAGAAQIPPINCGIVSCTYKLEQTIQSTQDTAGGILEKAQECVHNGVGAVENYLQGTPQPGVCNL